MSEQLQATFHALVMVAMIGGTVAYAIVARARPSLWRVVAAVGAALLTFVVLGLFGLHACGRGAPGHQIIIGSLSVLVVLLLVAQPRRAAIAALALFVGYGALVVHFNQLAHGQRTNGSSTPWPDQGRQLVAQARRAATGLPAAQAKRVFAAGWVAARPELEAAISTARGLSKASLGPLRTIEVSALWHSWLSGLHGRCERAAALWYPGGPLAKGIERLELRPRPSATCL
jgi:hypothetical protein